jgi:3-isopropylmalate/(R)-2-methylmalate dehydratase small subunit
MEPFRRLDAVALPMGTPNVDTDQIIPARFLWRKRSDGWGDLLFNDLRFNDDGSEKPQFMLNRGEYRPSQVLVGDRNFGCGSSREHAVWSLYDYGFRAVIAPSFGDIFFNNSFQNGLLPIVQPVEVCAALREALERQPGARIQVDLEAQKVVAPDGTAYAFAIDPFRKECLLAGTDNISFTLGQVDAITAFEKRYERALPWM